MHDELIPFSVDLYAKSKDVFYAKVLFPDLGMYLNSFTAKPSPKFPDSGLWVQPPKYHVQGKWISPIEFSKTSLLWKQIQASIRLSAEEFKSKDVVLNEIDNFDIEKALDDLAF